MWVTLSFRTAQILPWFSTSMNHFGVGEWAMREKNYCKLNLALLAVVFPVLVVKYLDALRNTTFLFCSTFFHRSFSSNFFFFPFIFNLSRALVGAPHCWVHFFPFHLSPYSILMRPVCCAFLFSLPRPSSPSPSLHPSLRTSSYSSRALGLFKILQTGM